MPNRRLMTAEVLSVGSELTAGETRDTNASEIARALTLRGVEVGRLVGLPDDLATVTGALRSGLVTADLVVSTGGLGPTPDDLTREAIAAVCEEEPTVDPETEGWLRNLWARREMAFPERNLKQAWLIPSATQIPNDNGTAPGWWVERPDGRVIVALPGPPREMRAMWIGWVLPRLAAIGLGREVEVRTLRLAGIGESQAADRLGDELLGARNPSVATYARADAVDVRISAVADDAVNGRRTAAELANGVEHVVLERLGDHVWARGDTTWPAAIGERLEALGWRLASLELGTGGTFAALLGDVPWLHHAESTADAPATIDLEARAEELRTRAGCQVGVAIRAVPRGEDTAVSVAIVSPRGAHRERRMAFLGGPMGRARAALTAAAIVLAELTRAVDTRLSDLPRPTEEPVR